MPLCLNQNVGTNQPDVEETSVKEIERPLASSGHVLTVSDGLATTMAW